MSFQSIPYSALLSLLFGLGLIASRVGSGQFGAVAFVSLRLAIASLGYVVVYAVDSRRPWPSNPRLWRYALLMGLLWTAIPQLAVVGSLRFQSAGVTSLLMTAGPAITVLLSHFLLPDEKLDIRKSAGVIIAMGGVFLLMLRGESGLSEMRRANPIGHLLVLLAMLINAFMTIFARRNLSQFSSLEVTSLRIWAGTGIVLPLTFLWDGFDFNAVDRNGLLSLGISSLFGVFGGYLLAFQIIKRFGTTSWATSIYLVPVVASIAGALLLDEQITKGMLAGMLLIGSGVGLVQYVARHPHLPEGI